MGIRSDKVLQQSVSHLDPSISPPITQAASKTSVNITFIDFIIDTTNKFTWWVKNNNNLTPNQKYNRSRAILGNRNTASVRLYLSYSKRFGVRQRLVDWHHSIWIHIRTWGQWIVFRRLIISCLMLFGLQIKLCKRNNPCLW
jgi:hypothetical protein